MDKRNKYTIHTKIRYKNDKSNLRSVTYEGGVERMGDWDWGRRDGGAAFLQVYLFV